LWNFLHPLPTVFFPGPNIIRSILGLCPSPNGRDQVLQPHKQQIKL
jgi:hypothetical protein